MSQVADNTPNLVLDNCLTTVHDAWDMAKSQTKTITFRPSQEDRRLIDKMAAKLGIKTSQVIKIALRRCAEVELRAS